MSTTYDTTAQVKPPQEILRIARNVFAASHWTTGAFSRREYTTYSELGFPEGPIKVQGCAIGGLRYAALAPMDNALDAAWMNANFVDLAEDDDEDTPGSWAQTGPYTVEWEGLHSYGEALLVLFAEVQGRRFPDSAMETIRLQRERWEALQLNWIDRSRIPEDPDERWDFEEDRHADTWNLIGEWEAAVISWNDGLNWANEEERIARVNDVILPTFDAAIASFTTTEGSN